MLENVGKDCAEAGSALLGSYYLLDLSYPSCLGQVLGVLQEVCLNEPILHGTAKFRNFVDSLLTHDAHFHILTNLHLPFIR